MLAGHVQDGAARHEQRQARCGRREPGEARRRLAHVLGVVHEEQQLLRGERGRECFELLRLGVVCDPEGMRDRGDDERRVV